MTDDSLASRLAFRLLPFIPEESWDEAQEVLRCAYGDKQCTRDLPDQAEIRELLTKAGIKLSMSFKF